MPRSIWACASRERMLLAETRTTMANALSMASAMLAWLSGVSAPGGSYQVVIPARRKASCTASRLSTSFGPWTMKAWDMGEGSA